MNVRRCAVCGVIATCNKFGDGITVPKTTCLNCKAKGLGFTEPKTVMDVKRIIRGGLNELRRMFKQG